MVLLIVNWKAQFNTGMLCCVSPSLQNCLIHREKDGKLRTVVADFGLAAKIKQRRYVKAWGPSEENNVMESEVSWRYFR